MNDRVGEKGINSQGLEMEIIAYRTNKDIDIKFIESGYINKNSYSNFKKGKIKDCTEELKRLGERRFNNKGEEMIIINYKGFSNVDIQFIKSGYINKSRSYSDFVKGEIKDYTVPYRKGKYLDDIPIREKNNIYIKMAKKYWTRMITRVDGGNTNKDYLHVYKDVKISEDWIYFSNFYEWFKKNFRFDLHEKGIVLEMDKDLMCGRDTKIYSPETVVFIPKSINMFLIKRQDNKHGFTGVTYFEKTKKYRSRMTKFGDGGKTTFLGFFKTAEEAHKAYLHAKLIDLKNVKTYMLELGYEKDLVEKINFYATGGNDNE